MPCRRMRSGGRNEIAAKFAPPTEREKGKTAQDDVYVLEDKSPTETWRMPGWQYLHYAVVSALKTGWEYLPGATIEAADEALRGYMAKLLPPRLTHLRQKIGIFTLFLII